MTNTPSMFSEGNPQLQVVWDSTSLKQLMFCPRSYQLSIIEGWRQPGAVDLEFGVLFASAIEEFKKGRLEGLPKDAALLRSLKRVVEESWIPGGDSGNCPCPDGCNGCEHPHGRPWGGHYAEQWRCTGTEPYKNKKGNKAKCPWSHKGKWFPEPAPSICGECGSATETHRHWLPTDKVKNRVSLVRAVIWYIEEQPEDMDQAGLKPYAFPDGRPAVELSFKIPLDLKTPFGESYILAGHMDSIMETSDGTERFITDNKTTKKPMGKAFFAGYNPSVQVQLYDIAGSILYPSLNIRGVAIEGAQILSDGARFGIQPFPQTEAQREESLTNILDWIKIAEGYAMKGHWPMATANCWLCPFKSICSKDPEVREMFLRADFEVRKWNPLEER